MTNFTAQLSLPFLILMILILGIAGDLLSSDPFFIAGQFAGLAMTISARISARNHIPIAEDPEDTSTASHDSKRLVCVIPSTGCALR